MSLKVLEQYYGMQNILRRGLQFKDYRDELHNKLVNN